MGGAGAGTPALGAWQRGGLQGALELLGRCSCSVLAHAPTGGEAAGCCLAANQQPRAGLLGRRRPNHGG